MLFWVEPQLSRMVSSPSSIPQHWQVVESVAGNPLHNDRHLAIALQELKDQVKALQESTPKSNHPAIPDSSTAPLPAPAEQALIKAECALADIAEGEGENDDTSADALEWAEQRAAKALVRIRPIMRQHGIHTSEWPPTSEGG